MEGMIIVKVHSSEWCDAEVYEVVSKHFAKFEVEPRDIEEFKCLKGEYREWIEVNKEFAKCLKNYGANVVFVVECKYDYPQIVLILS